MSLKSLALRAKKFNPDSVVVLGNDQMGVALSTIRSLGIAAPFYGVGSFLSPGFTKLAGGAVEGAFVSAWMPVDSVALEGFKDNFKKRYGRFPLLDLATMPSYEGARAVVSALPQALDSQGEVDFVKLRHAIVTAAPYEGVVGKVAFDADGAVRTIHEELTVLREGTLHRISQAKE